jgi:hypothetical protein
MGQNLSRRKYAKLVAYFTNVMTSTNTPTKVHVSPGRGPDGQTVFDTHRGSRSIYRTVTPLGHSQMKSLQIVS